MHIFVVHRKGKIIEVTSVVLTLAFYSNDIVVCHCFFSYFFFFCILQLAYVASEQATLYNDIVWLLNQDTYKLRYKSWTVSAPFVKQFQNHRDFFENYLSNIS